jgi:uncharacterized protein (UPF0261 family)
MLKVADYLALCANESVGPIEIIIPTEGYSIPNVPGGVFWNRDADQNFEDRLIEKTRNDIWIEKLPMHVNSREFGIATAQRFISLLNQETKKG